jgi:hypothetical protein
MKKVLCLFAVLVLAAPVLAVAAPPASPIIVNASSVSGELVRLKIAALHEQIRELLAQPNPDAAAIGNLMLQIKDFREQIPAQNKDRIIQYLALTPSQVTQWEGFVETRNQNVQPLRVQIRTLNGQIRGLLEQSHPDPAALGNLRIQVKEAMDKIKTAREAYIAAFKGILTADQIKKLDLVLKLEAAKPRPPMDPR